MFGSKMGAVVYSILTRDCPLHFSDVYLLPTNCRRKYLPLAETDPSSQPVLLSTFGLYLSLSLVFFWESANMRICKLLVPVTSVCPSDLSERSTAEREVDRAGIPDTGRRREQLELLISAKEKNDSWNC